MHDRLSVSRRAFLGATAATTAASTVGAATSSARAVVDEVRVISRTPHLYCGWPTMTRRADGQLIVVYSGGREAHVCPFGRVEMMRSHDDGKTWTWPRVLLDGPIDDRDSGIVETSKGTLLVTTFTSLAYQDYYLNKAMSKQPDEQGAWPAEKLDRWLAAHRRINAAERQAELGQWMIRSTDGGITWSARYPSIVNSPHGPITLADGRLLYAGVMLWDQPRRVGVCQSIDDGESWQWLSAIPTRDGDDLNAYHELHAVECADGKIIVHIRNQNRANDRETLQSESSDGGSTWSTPHPIGVWGLPSHLLSLPDGRLLMSYGYRRKPFGIQARVSSDCGKTWGPALTITDDGANGDLGYPSTQSLDDGSLLTVWYEQMAASPRAVLRQARWSIED